jgi:hypothetical protein
MSAERDPVTVIFPPSYDERAEYETPLKGFLCDVVVRLEDGFRYKLFFTDPARLQQTVEDDFTAGREYYAEPGLMLLPEVTTEAVRRAVTALWRDGCFQQMKPMEEPEESST